MFVEFVDDCLKCEGCVGVGSEGILGGGDDIMFREVSHELGVDEGVEEFGDDGKERDGTIEFWEGSVCLFEKFYDFGDLEGVWVVVFVDCLIEESGEDGC